MKIITNKTYEQIKSLAITNKFLSNGYRAMSICLDFEKAIIEIMKQCNLKEIELPKRYLIDEDILEVAENPLNNSFIVKIKEVKNETY